MMMIFFMHARNDADNNTSGMMINAYGWNGYYEPEAKTIIFVFPANSNADTREGSESK